MRTPVKRLPAHVGSGLPWHADLEKHLAVERAFAHEMAAIIGQVDRLVRPHVDAVRPRVEPFSPRAQEIALAIEDDDRMLSAGEAVHVVARVDADRGDLLE